jgi:hypothetical protein
VQYWKVNTIPFRGNRYEDIEKQAQKFFSGLKAKTKRKIHIRSKFFKGEKVFFDYFWQHLYQKPVSQRRKRLKFLLCGMEVLINSTYQPEKKINPSKKTEIFYRFYGITKNNQVFAIQVKETKKSKQLMSVFPLV